MSAPYNPQDALSSYPLGMSHEERKLNFSQFDQIFTEYGVRTFLGQFYEFTSQNIVNFFLYQV